MVITFHSNPYVRIVCHKVTINEPNYQSLIRFSLHPDSSHREVRSFVGGSLEREEHLVGPTVNVKLANYIEDSRKRSCTDTEQRYPHHSAIAAIMSNLDVDDLTKGSILARVIYYTDIRIAVDRLFIIGEERFDLNVMVKLSVTTAHLITDVFDGIDWMVPAAEEAIEGLARVRFHDLLGNVKGVNNRDDERECVICYEDFKGESLVTRLECSHVFHSVCLFEWLATSHYCPLCRFDLPTRDR